MEAIIHTCLFRFKVLENRLWKRSVPRCYTTFGSVLPAWSQLESKRFWKRSRLFIYFQNLSALIALCALGSVLLASKNLEAYYCSKVLERTQHSAFGSVLPHVRGNDKVPFSKHKFFFTLKILKIQ